MQVTKGVSGNETPVLGPIEDSKDGRLEVQNPAELLHAGWSSPGVLAVMRHRLGAL